MLVNFFPTQTLTLGPGTQRGFRAPARAWATPLFLVALLAVAPAVTADVGAAGDDAQAEAITSSAAGEMENSESSEPGAASQDAAEDSATENAGEKASGEEAAEVGSVEDGSVEEAGSGEEGANAVGEDASADDDSTDDSAEEEKYEWLVEEDTERIYRVATLPKVEGTFRRFEGGKIRVPGGSVFRVVKENDDTFWVKVYKKGPRKAKQVQQEPEMTEAKREELLAEYEIELVDVDRIRLRPMDEGLPKAGQWRDGFDVADMNADGHLDIVFGPARKASNPRPNIFLGDGEGNWRRWSSATFEPVGYDYGDIAVADWNADGHPDLVLGVHLRGLLALVNDGRGNFRVSNDGIDFDMPGTETPLAAFSSRTVRAADWNGDGRVDILAFGEGPKRNTGAQKDAVQGSSGFRVYLNQEDGSWQGVQQTKITDTNFGADFATLDVDGDGTKDVVMGTMVVGNPWLVLHRTSDIGSTTEKLEPLRPNGIVDSLSTADFDGDGVDDLAMAYRVPILGKWHTGIDVLLNRADGWQRQAVLSRPVRHGFGGLAAGDLDGDGRQDIVAGDDEGEIWILLAQEDGTFARDVTLEGPQPRIGCHVFDVQLHDFDHDGRLEIAAAYAGESQAMVSALVGNTLTGCEDGGSLRVWDVELVEENEEEAMPAASF